MAEIEKAHIDFAEKAWNEYEKDLAKKIIDMPRMDIARRSFNDALWKAIHFVEETYQNDAKRVLERNW